MNRSGLATVVAVVLMVAALVWSRSRDQGGVSSGSEVGQTDATASTASSSSSVSSDPSPPSAPPVAADDLPKEVVWKMVDASKARDVASYLDCFGGDLRTRLDASVREMGESGFADYLGRRVEELKGVALYDVEVAPEGGAALTVEYVFANEKELQRLHLEQDRGAWRITAADASRREKSLIPYGTPIEQVD